MRACIWEEKKKCILSSTGNPNLTSKASETWKPVELGRNRVSNPGYDKRLDRQGLDAYTASLAPGETATSQAVLRLAFHHVPSGKKHPSFLPYLASHTKHPLFIFRMSHPDSPPKKRDYITLWSITEHEIINKLCRWRGVSHGSLCSCLHHCVLKITYFFPHDRNQKLNKTQKKSSKCPLMKGPIYYVRLCLSNRYWNSSQHVLRIYCVLGTQSHLLPSVFQRQWIQK